MARAELRTRATLDPQPFRRGVGVMRGEVQAFASGQLRSLGGMIGGAFAVGALVRFARTQMQAADNMIDLARNVGVGTEAIQALQVETLKYGGTAEGVNKALAKLKQSVGDAAAGNTTLQRSFRALGIEQSALANMNTEQALQAVARGYREAGGTAEAYNAVAQILGRSGKDLTGVLMSVGNDGLQTLIDKGKEAGTVLEDQLIARLARANDELEILGKQSGNFLVRLGAGLGGTISDAAAFYGAATRVGFAEARRQLTRGEIGTDADISKLRDERANARVAADEEERRGRRASRAAAIEAEIDKLTEKIREPDLEKVQVTGPRAADMRAAIGGFTGGQTSPMQGVAERQLKTQELIAKTTEQTQKILDEIKGLQQEQRDLLRE